MSIRKKLRDRAAMQLNNMLENLEDAARDITTASQVDARDLCKLVASPEHSKTLRRQVITKMVNEAEDRIAEQLDAEVPE